MTAWLVPEGRSDGLELAVGHAVDWHRGGEPIFLDSQPHAFATREITAAPRGLPTTPGLSSEPWASMRGVAEAVLSDAALLPGCAALEVRYSAVPNPAGSVRIRMYVTAKTRDWHPHVAQAAVSLACDKLPEGFTASTPHAPLGFGMSGPDDEPVVELRREEEVSFPQWDHIPFEFYYRVAGQPGDGSGWAGFWRSLCNVAHPVTVSLLVQGTRLDDEELDRLAGTMTDLGLEAQPRTEHDFFNNPIYYPACSNAASTLESWEGWLERLHRPVLARLAVRGNALSSVPVATALASAVSAGAAGAAGAAGHPMVLEAASTPAEQRQAAFGFDWLEILPWGGHQVWGHELAPVPFRRFAYLYGASQAAGLLVLPVPDDQGVAGMPTSSPSVQLREGVFDADADGTDQLLLGNSLHNGAMGSARRLPVDALTQHVLVVGSTGFGKTTSVMTLMVRLWREKRIPFMVIEPEKTEYRSLLDPAAIPDLQVITIGREQVNPLRLNPMQPPPGVACESHKGAVLSSLRLALPLFSPLPEILRLALNETYDDACWDSDTTPEDGLAPPTLRDLRRCFQTVFDRLDYKGEALNMGRGFLARLDSLLTGSLGRTLDTASSSNFDELLSRPVVIELEHVLDEDDAAVAAALVLDRVRAAARSRGSSGGRLRHVLVLEEAHRLLSQRGLTEGNEAAGDTGRRKSIEAFCRAISTLRGRGQGFVLCSQLPDELAGVAVANTSTRLIHHLEREDDRKSMLKDFGTDQPQLLKVAARLSRGAVIARWPGQEEAELVQVAVADGVDSGRQVDDDQVADAMSAQRTATRALLPHRMCSLTVCPAGCLTKIRDRSARLAGRLGPQAARTWLDDPRPVQAVVDQVVEVTDDLQSAYCTLAHLEATGTAFGDAGDSAPRRGALETTLRERWHA